MTCAHCEDLKEEVAYLKSELGLRNDAERVEQLRRQGVRPAEAAMLCRLYAAGGKLVTVDQLEEAIPAKDPARERTTPFVRTYASRIRSRMGRDIIGNMWGRGYYLTDRGMAVVGPMLGGGA